MPKNKCVLYVKSGVRLMLQIDSLSKLKGNVMILTNSFFLNHINFILIKTIG